MLILRPYTTRIELPSEGRGEQFMMEEALFVPGQSYRRRDLHKRWGGQRQGGISTPSRNNIILLFTGDAGQQHGYRDECF